MNRFHFACLLALAVVILVWSNHFSNPFHGDDWMTVALNPAITSIQHPTRFWTDVTTFGALPYTRSYRPVTVTSIAFDYWLGGGRNIAVFRIAAFAWFLLLLGILCILFRRIFDATRAEPGNRWWALAAGLVFAVHPALSQTLATICQRAEILSTLGVAAGLTMFACWPGKRKYGLYLLPVVLGQLAKPPAVVFPAILAVYLLLFERERWLRRCVPSLVVCGAVVGIIARMTPRDYQPSVCTFPQYVATQPFTLVNYFRRFFDPTSLVALRYAEYSPVDWGRLSAGLTFLVLSCTLTIWCARKDAWRPVGFGLAWCILSTLPTSLFPLVQADSDYRLFFMYPGLALAAVWTIRMLVPRSLARWLLVVAMLALGMAAYDRNRLWANDVAVTEEIYRSSPNSDESKTRYAASLLRQGRTQEARRILESFFARERSVEGWRLIMLAQVFAREGRRQTAMLFAVAAIQENPYDEGLRFGASYLLSGREAPMGLPRPAGERANAP